MASATTNNTNTLNKLPAELRVMVYEAMYNQLGYLDLKNSLPLLQTSRDIRSEAVPVFRARLEEYKGRLEAECDESEAIKSGDRVQDFMINMVLLENYGIVTEIEEVLDVVV